MNVILLVEILMLSSRTNPEVALNYRLIRIHLSQIPEKRNVVEAWLEVTLNYRLIRTLLSRIPEKGNVAEAWPEAVGFLLHGSRCLWLFILEGQQVLVPQQTVF